jgi:hypothetical protein
MNKQGRLYILLFILIMALSGCKTSPSIYTPPAETNPETPVANNEPTPYPAGTVPQVINHPYPVLTNDLQAWLDAGWKEDENSYLVNPDLSNTDVQSCTYIQAAHDLLGGLQPKYPLAVCQELPEDRAADEPPNVYISGCLLPDYIRYIYLKDGKLNTIHNKQEFQKLYAPITSPDEAISYAQAVTGYSALFDIHADPEFRYFTKTMEDTFVTKTDEGYRVHLYHFRICGCGPHATFSVDVLVKPDGSISEQPPQKLYEDPSLDGLCVD